jgi:hypothetical protein
MIAVLAFDQSRKHPTTSLSEQKFSVAEVVRRWVLMVLMLSLHAVLESDIDQILGSDVETAYAVGSAVVAAELASGWPAHWTVRISVHVASQERCADIVAVVGTTVVPSEPADRPARNDRCVFARSRGVGTACCSAVRAVPSFEEATVGIVAEAVDEPWAAVWDDADVATLAVLRMH